MENEEKLYTGRSIDWPAGCYVAQELSYNGERYIVYIAEDRSVKGLIFPSLKPWHDLLTHASQCNFGFNYRHVTEGDLHDSLDQPETVASERQRD